MFSSDEDCVAWLDILGAVCERFNWTCHAYCLMRNHYHLVVETIEGNLARGMRQLNGVYAQYVNRTHGRVGHVLRGRYKAILLAKDAYLVELARYVVSQSRAGRDGGAGRGLAVDGLPRGLGRTRSTARRKYIDFVRSGVGLPSIWDKLTGQLYLGVEAFVQRMVALAQHKSGELEVPPAQRRPQARPLSHYVSSYADRKEGMAQAYATGDFTLSQVAEAFGVHYATVSRAISEKRRR